ncbi:class IIb bacteriocin, lactobin A/cerein 7B family [Echinicola shivajiensis]|uniref:class IIb bacteriocin, lactobin A/cerein 7B family n=1 Tax=Echinicola shivajiensis TaxID=1035916 RepID=UPI001BFCC7F9|nr:class IIb bacteriocin, lactobin A/cerein 7B family [Echinicola shivajiensis]
MKDNNIKIVELNTDECTSINGGWIGIAIEIISAFGTGFSAGYGYGSYDCDCPDSDGRRFDEMGPTHYRA